MQRSASVASSARPLASFKAAEAKEETFVLRATPSIKRYNIARFDTPQLPRFQTCAQPVLMFREPERVIEDDEDGKEDEVVGYNPALRKRRRRRRKDTRTAGWVIEDQDGSTKFNGVFEGGQSSTYMLLVKNRHNDEFSVIPVEQWFRFKKPLNYRTLTLEEAEDLNNEKKRAVERWLMKHRLAGDEKAETGDTVSAPRVRTGAVGGGASSSSSSAARAKKAEADDIFEVQESRPKRAVRPKKAAQEGAQGEDGGDFDEKFDDDESDAEIEHEDKAVASSSDDEEFEVDPEGTGKLTETGQAMKDLLKRAQSGEMLGDAAKGENDDKDDNDNDNDDDDDDYSAKDMDKIKRDLGGNIIRDRSDGSVGGTGATAADGAKPGGSSGADSGAGGGSGDAGASAGNAVTKSAGSSVGDKRKADEVGKAKDETPSKAAKTAGGSSSLSTANKLSEAGVQQELIRYGGRMRTRDLLKKLKKLLVTDNDRALLKDILRTICDVEVDAIDGRLLVLKSQFR